MSNKRTALVVGGAGVIGRNLVNYLVDQSGWEVIGLSRNKPELGKKVRWSQIDLLDQSDVAAKIGEAYQALAQVTDATLHAEASVWAAVTPSAKNEIFNVTNGDFFRWEQLWPKIDEFFDMPIAEPQTISLVNWMADKGPIWDAIVAKHRLQPHKLEALAGWKFGDLVFGSDYDVMSDTTKIRQHGFQRVEASDIMMIRLLKEFREAAVIP